MRWFSDPDATVVLLPSKRKRGLPGAAAGLLAVMLLGGAAAWIVFRNPAPDPELPRLAAADEAEILAAHPVTMLLFRFAPAPGILVADFPSLHAQARALNRAAVFLELAGASRDRVPDDAAVNAAVAGARLDYDRFYYGHDYRAVDLHRMWRLGDASGIALAPEEQALRKALLRVEATSGGFGAVISLPPAGTGLQDANGRAAILRHELSHGLYFTDPAYASAVHAFWETGLSAVQRAGFRRFLASSLYDPSNEQLMENEMQAYLVNTPDTRFFRPRDAALDDAAAAKLRLAFISAMPEGWLRVREAR